MSDLSTIIVLRPEEYDPADLSEIAPGVFIFKGYEAAFERALDTDQNMQAEYSAILYNLDAYTMADEVAPEIADTYAPIIQHVRFRKALEAGESYAVDVARACAEIGLNSRRKPVRTSVAPFALTFNKSH